MRARMLGLMLAVLLAAVLAAGGVRMARLLAIRAPGPAGSGAPGDAALGDAVPEAAAPVARITQREPIPPRAWLRAAGGPVARLVLRDGAIDPARLEADRLDRVRLLVQNRGQQPHNLIIPDFRIITAPLDPGAETYVEFTVGQKGEFAVYSDAGRPGQPEPGLLAVLVVR